MAPGKVACAIGVAQPTGVYVHTFGMGKVDDDKLAAYVAEKLDMRPRAIIEQLDLLRPICRPSAAYGHFGAPRRRRVITEGRRASSVAGPSAS